MSATFLMSYPGPAWQIRGGQNFRSQERAATSPRAALREWIALGDAIVRAGGHILVMPPAAPELTGMVYTANAGQLFHSGDSWIYLVSRMATAHRLGEADLVQAFVEQAGIACARSQQVWEGQADLQTLGGQRYIATWGVRSAESSLGEVRSMLPPGARVLDLRLQEPFFHGDTCLDPLTNRAGDTVLLAHGGGFADGRALDAIRAFVGDRLEVIPVDGDDARGYACNSLCVNGTVLLPTGLSTSLRGQLVRRGFQVEELAFPELFGKGGGGPRCLANDLRGLVVGEGAPEFTRLREEIVALLASYPESLPPPPAT